MPDVWYHRAEATPVKILPAKVFDPSVSPSATSFHRHLSKNRKKKRKLFCFMGVGGLGLTGATGVHFKCHPLLQRFEYLSYFCLTPSATMKQYVEISSWWGGGHQSVCFRESDFSLIGQQSSLLKCFLPSKQNLNKYKHVCGTLKEIYKWKIVYPQQKYIDTVFWSSNIKRGILSQQYAQKKTSAATSARVFTLSSTPRESKTQPLNT